MLLNWNWGNVKLGQKAEVTVDAFKDKKLREK